MVYVLEHNRICRELAAFNPRWDNGRLFQAARVVMMHRHARIFLENFASNIVLHANDVQARILASINLCASDGYADLCRQELRLHLEYVHAYTLHELIPDSIDYGNEASIIGGGNKSLAGEMFQNAKDFDSLSIQSHLDAFYRTAAGTFDSQNVPAFLKDVTVRQIEDSQRNGIGSYVEYNDFFGGAPICTFDDLGHNKYTRKVFREVYSSVHDIEAYVGTLLEASFLMDNHGPNRPLVRMSMILSNVIPNFVRTSCYKDKYLYSEEFLSKRGLEMIAGPTDALVSILEHHVELQDGTPFTRYNEELTYQPEYSLTDTSSENFSDFVGLNELWWHALRNDDEYQYMYGAVVVAAMGYVLLYSWGKSFIRKYIKRVAEHSRRPFDDGADDDVVLASHYFVVAFVLLAQSPVYTVIMIFVYFSQRPDLAMEKFWFAGFLMAATHMVLYVADIAARTAVRWVLWAHHTIWLLFFLLPPVFRDIFALKVGLVLDYFVVFEAGLYWALFWSKVSRRQFSPRARTVGRWGVHIYGLSRLLQCIALGFLFARGYSRMAREAGRAALYWVVFALALCAQASQLQVLKEFWGWKSLFGIPQCKCEGEREHTIEFGGDGQGAEEKGDAVAKMNKTKGKKEDAYQLCDRCSKKMKEEAEQMCFLDFSTASLSDRESPSSTPTGSPMASLHEEQHDKAYV